MADLPCFKLFYKHNEACITLNNNQAAENCIACRFCAAQENWVEAIRYQRSSPTHKHFKSCSHKIPRNEFYFDNFRSSSCLLVLEAFLIDSYPWLDLGLGHFITFIRNSAQLLAIYFNSSNRHLRTCYGEQRKETAKKLCYFMKSSVDSQFLPGLVFVRNKLWRCNVPHVFNIKYAISESPGTTRAESVLSSCVQSFPKTSELTLFNLCRNKLLLTLCKDVTRMEECIAWAENILPNCFYREITQILEFIRLVPQLGNFLNYLLSRCFFPSQALDLWQKRGHHLFAKHGRFQNNKVVCW